MIHKAVKEKQLKEEPPEQTGDEILEETFGPRDKPIVDLPDPNDKTPWIAKDHGDRPNSAAPVHAGGTDSAAEAVVDGIWTEKGLGGIDAMPEKQRRRWVTKVAEIVERWGGATKEQARLAWQAHTVKLGWKTDVNPFHKGFGDDFGPLLVGVRNGDITVEALRAEEEERPVPTTRDRAGNPHVYRPAEEVAVEVYE